MPETSPVKAVESDSIDMKALADQLTQVNRDSVEKFTRDLLVVQNRLYSQLESLSWLQRILKIKGQLPPLSGWAASPDVLLMLHNWVKTNRPKCIVEFGSGASTIVIADALRQMESVSCFHSIIVITMAGKHLNRSKQRVLMFGLMFV